jgi:hypothetical protein
MVLMANLFIIIGYIKQFLKQHSIAKLAALGVALCLLSGCLGGTVAQQIVRSIATSVADKTVARAMGVEEEQDYSDAQYAAADKLSSENTAMQRSLLQGAGAPSTQHILKAPLPAQPQQTQLDEYAYMLATARFEPTRAISEPLPTAMPEPEAPVQIVQANQLVHVEVFNLLIGAEKEAVYDEARMLGATSLPNKREWQRWQVGVGAIEHTKKVITFLIPPEFGKLPSGAIAMVEIAGPGELNIARYEPSNLRYKQLIEFKAENTKPLPSKQVIVSK